MKNFGPGGGRPSRPLDPPMIASLLQFTLISDDKSTIAFGDIEGAIFLRKTRKVK